MNKRLFLLIIVAFAVTSCAPSGPTYTIQKLPSGKKIKVLSVGKMLFSGGDRALMLKYQTEIPLDNKTALREEVEEIWKYFKLDVEKTDSTSAIISANEPPKGFIVTTNKNYNFVIQKDKDGNWKFLEDKN